MTNSKEDVVDLHNECSVDNITVNGSKVIVSLTKKSDYTKSKFIKVGAKISLVISNIHSTELPEFDFPESFEGIYDYKVDSLNLCIGDRACYPVRGKNLQFTLETIAA